jgi:hypothetical protein
MINEVQVEVLEKSSQFLNIRNMISESLRIDLSKSEENVCEQLTRALSLGPIPDLRLDANLMISIESELVDLFQVLGLEKFQSMQFPANIRIVNNLPQESSGTYATDLLHCDSWSGAPQDTLNLFLGIFVAEKAPWLKMFKTLSRNHPAFSYVGPYINAPINHTELIEVDVPRKFGTLVMWPTQTPHKTHLASQHHSGQLAWRVSVDIRLRESHPYSNFSELSDENFSNNKMNSLGVYWSKPEKKFLTINEKIAAELDMSKQFSLNALRARELYLAKYYE